MPKTTSWQYRMAIFVVGINHKTAPIGVREKIFFCFDKLSLYLKDLLNSNAAREAVLLSTCNRSELYCEADHSKQVIDWFCAQANVNDRSEIQSYLYVHENEEALKHIMRVACGLDSMIVGEPQILGQMKDAFSESCAVPSVSSLFHRLFQEVFSVAKDIRTTTAIGACPVSVASAAVYFAKQKINLENAKTLVIGAGDTCELLLRYLNPLIKSPITIINRHDDKANRLAKEFGGRAQTFGQLKSVLIDTDLVFSATGSPLPLVTKEVLLPRKKPIRFIDIAVPRDIADDVNELENVELYCIDHLKTIIENNRRGREHAAEKADEMINQKSNAFMRTIQSLNSVAYTIRSYRSQIEDLCDAELIKAKELLYQGMDPADVLDNFARAFIKKLLHTPSVQLRQAGAEGRLELLRLAKQLFAIPDSELERV